MCSIYIAQYMVVCGISISMYNKLLPLLCNSTAYCMVDTIGRTTVAAAYSLVWDVCSFLTMNDHEVYAKLILVGIEIERPQQERYWFMN